MKVIKPLNSICLFLLILCGTFKNGYSQNLYAVDTVRIANIVFYDANWEGLLDSFKINDLSNRVLADITIDGILYDSVGVKFKGNSSYNSVGAGKKKPFNISIDYIKNQDVYGYTTIKLNNMFKDPSCIREVLSYEMLQNYMPASQANFMEVSINGNLHGIYNSIESVNNDFLLKHFDSNNNSFFKCDPIWGSPPPMGCPPSGGSMSALYYTNSDTACYKNSYEIKSDFDIAWVELVNLIQILNNNTSQIPQVLDVDRAMWMLAFNNLFVNFDSYTGSGHNYYVYENDYNRFNTIVWDLNENFGGFSNAGGQPPSNLSLTDMQNLSPLWNDQDIYRPLIKSLMAIPDYKKRYFAHYRTIVNEFLANNTMKNRAVELQTFIDSYIASDPNLIYSYNDFLNGLNQMNGNVPGINELMDPRYTYLSSETNMIKVGPMISSVQQSISIPTAMDSIWITSNISGSNQAKLHYKDNLHAPFQAVSMFDDGNHNDGAMGDGVFGAIIPPHNPASTIYYYIYAENNDAGRFSPERAEYEFYSYTIEGEQLAVGELVINEFMASNDITVTDQNGEYDDWIELYNNSADPINLNNMYISDNLTTPYKWRLPDSVIAADDFIILWADNDVQNGIHTNFKLSSLGESIVLSNSDGTILDSISFSLQSNDITYGRYPNGTGSFQFMAPTFNDYNTLLSIQDKDKEFTYNIYPNPASNVLNIKVNTGLANKIGINTIGIYDVLMRKLHPPILKINHRTFTISLDGLSEGIYFVKVDNCSQKLIITKN